MANIQPVLFDLGPLPCECTDAVLETIYKSLSERPDTSAIWIEHHDPWVRAHLEAVTARGLKVLAQIEATVTALLAGHISEVFGHSSGVLRKAFKWVRLADHELDEIRDYLAAKEPGSYTLDDNLLAIDWIVSRYLPDGVIDTEAEYLAVRAQIIGKMQAAAPKGLPEHEIEMLAASAADTLEAARRPVSRMEDRALQFSRARAAELIRDVGERTRARMKHLIIAHEEKVAFGDPGATHHALHSQLLDEFGILNRDWRRIAVTEVARDVNEGLIASLHPGTRVKRTEAYAGACPFCRHIHGMIFTVVLPSKRDKDGASEVWVGKTNVGRSASPRKREGDELVERTADEVWWPAAGVQHPNCRGAWTVLPDQPDAVDPEFARQLERELEALTATE